MNINRRRFNLIVVAAFIFLLCVPTLDNIFNISPNIKIDLKENRNLTSFPDHNRKFSRLFKKFPEEFDNYYNDNFGFRNIIIWSGRLIFPINNNSANKSSRYIKGQNDWLFLNEGSMTKDILGLDPLQKYQIKIPNKNSCR
jgi:hypothetical protein